jgi:hypothetical protein
LDASVTRRVTTYTRPFFVSSRSARTWTAWQFAAIATSPVVLPSASPATSFGFVAGDLLDHDVPEGERGLAGVADALHHLARGEGVGAVIGRPQPNKSPNNQA